VSSDNPKVNVIAKLIADTFAKTGYVSVLSAEYGDGDMSYVIVDGSYDLEELAAEIIKEVVGPDLIVNAQADILDDAARDLGWFGAQGNLIHPDTANAGLSACIKAVRDKADRLRKGEKE
jgi:hypothetical protein